MTSLPIWMQIFSFIVAAILGLLQIASLINRPILKIRLTKEVFFRITDLGECIFANLVYLSQNGANEIQKIGFTLNKTSTDIKQYTLDVMYVGTKKIGYGPIADHHFTTKSTVSLVPKDSFGPVVFMLRQSNYSKTVSDEIGNFREIINKIKERDKIVSRSQGTPEIFNKISEAAQTTTLKIMPSIQLESGNYALEVTVRYKSLGTFPYRQLKCTHSRINFSVSGEFRKTYENDLKKLFEVLGQGILFNEQPNLPFPEYNPDAVTEFPD